MVVKVHAIPEIEGAVDRKDPVRILDLGSGTGGAVVGVLLALSGVGRRRQLNVEVTSLDGNRDALEKQHRILAHLQDNLGFGLEEDQHHEVLPLDLPAFEHAFSDFVEQMHGRYDLIP